jgi:hypothetical protein
MFMTLSLVLLIAHLVEFSRIMVKKFDMSMMEELKFVI